MMICELCHTDYTAYNYTEDDLVDILDLLRDEIIVVCPDCAENLVLSGKYEYV